MKISIQKLLFVLISVVLLAVSASAAPTFTISPNTISNTYTGPVIFQITGLTSGDTVVMQKFIDANADGVVDAGDPLWQQVRMTDGQPGMVIGGVTNNNIIGDTDGAANGQITAKSYIANDFSQMVIAKYLFVLSSPSGHFTPITNSFTVTNFPYAQSFTGSVVSGSSPLADASILIFPGVTGGHDLGNPVASVVANNSGNYSVKLPAGNYLLIPFKSNYVANLTSAANVILGAGATVTTNLSLTVATTTISGNLYDANSPGTALPGVLVSAQSTNLLMAVTVTDTNGNFKVPVTSDKWKIDVVGSSLDAKGYLSAQGKPAVNTSGGPVTGVSIGLTKATAVFYGTVKDSSGKPLTGVAVYTSDNNGNYQMDGYTDTNGNYVVGAVGDSSGDQWYVQQDYGGPANYIYSQGISTALTAGQAYHYNFTGILATNLISGNVQFNGNPVSGVNVGAGANIGGIQYNSGGNADANGNYSFPVANGNWGVNVSCSGGNNSLDSLIGAGNYQCPNSQNVTINSSNATVNFVVQPPGGGQIFGYVKDTTANPIGGVNVYATDGFGDNYSTTTDGTGYYSFNVVNNNFGVSVDCTQLGNLGYQCVGTNFVTISNNSIDSDFIVPPQAQPLQMLTTSLPNGTNGAYYNQLAQATGGTPPYGWFIPTYSAALPANLTLANNGVISGTVTASANTFYFDLVVTDSVANAVTNTLSLTIVNPPQPPLTITNVSFPNGTVSGVYSAHLGATGGQPPYTWSIALGSANPPPGLMMDYTGLISGTPTTNGLFNFKVQVNDSGSSSTNKVFGIIINPRPALTFSAWLTNRFFLQISGASNQNYTVLVSTNLDSSSWVPILVTNNTAANTYIVADPNATNQQRYYRVKVGP